jgi:hypothetical protein
MVGAENMDQLSVWCRPLLSGIVVRDDGLPVPTTLLRGKIRIAVGRRKRLSLIAATQGNGLIVDTVDLRRVTSR